MSTLVSVLTTVDRVVEACVFHEAQAGATVNISGGSGNEWFIKCNTCGACGPRDKDAEAAVDKWNFATRNTQQQVRDAIKAAVDASKMEALDLTVKS